MNANVTTLAEARTRRSFTIVVANAVWRGFDVQIEPPTTSYPLRHFRVRAEAFGYAEELAATEGWPIRDRTHDADPEPPRAA